MDEQLKILFAGDLKQIISSNILPDKKFFISSDIFSYKRQFIFTALHIAAYTGNLELCHYYMKECSADTLIYGEYATDTGIITGSPIFFAIESECLNIVRYFIKQGVSINIDNSDIHICSTLLDRACSTGNLEIVHFLIEQGVDPNYNRALWCSLDYPEIFKFLIQSGAYIYFQGDDMDLNSYTCLEWAIINNNIPAIHVVLSNGYNINYKNTDSEYSAIHIACDLPIKEFSIEIVQILIDHGIIFQKNQLLHYATYHKNKELLDFLLQTH